MPSAIELSIKFGIPASSVTAMCDYLDVALDDASLEYSKEFETLARSIKRKRASAYVMAFLFLHCSEAEKDFALSLDENFADEYVSVSLPIYPAEKLKDAKEIIDAIHETQRGEKRGEWDKFEKWLKKTISDASGEISHSYIAVRLLLSIPEKEMRDYPQIIASLMNKARHRGYLDGWFRLVPIDGDKNRCVYFDPETRQDDAPGETQWLSPEIVDQAKRTLKTDDTAKLAGYIAFQVKREFSETLKAVEKILAEKTFFDL